MFSEHMICQTPHPQAITSYYELSTQYYMAYKNACSIRMPCCPVCGKPYDEIFEETISVFSHQTAEPAGKIRDRHSKSEAFLECLPRGMFNFVPEICRRLPAMMDRYTR